MTIEWYGNRSGSWISRQTNNIVHTKLDTTFYLVKTFKQSQMVRMSTQIQIQNVFFFYDSSSQKAFSLFTHYEGATSSHLVASLFLTVDIFPFARNNQNVLMLADCVFWWTPNERFYCDVRDKEKRTSKNPLSWYFDVKKRKKRKVKTGRLLLRGS